MSDWAYGVCIGGSVTKDSNQFCYTPAMRNDPANRNKTLCKLPLGTFVLAIVST